MVKVEPDLPEPPTEPATFLARPTDCFLVKRRLLARRVKVDDTQYAVFRCQHVLDAVQQCVEAWDLRTRGRRQRWEWVPARTYHGQRIAQRYETHASFGVLFSQTAFLRRLEEARS